MFDAILKPKFYTKCKSRLKLIKTRVETIQKKRNAVQKFLKKDIADLLRNDLDYNAYGRAEGLLVEQNMSSCYELIIIFVNCVLGHVGDLCKQRDIPDECKQAIQSLIYAAARFSDLPELRELRMLFTGKFGKNNLEHYINREFVEKLRQDPPSKEMKIDLIHELAQEFSIKWNSKALEQRLDSSPQLYEVNMFTGGKQRDGTDCHTSDENERGTPSEVREDISDAYWRLQNSTEDETITDSSSLDGHKAGSSSLGSVSEDDADIKRSFSYKHVPPPYVIEKLNKSESKKSKPMSVRRRPLKPPLEDNTVSDFKTRGTAKVDSSGKEDDEEKIMDVLLMHYSNKQSGHVHPSLPDYDDLSARLAALRKTSQPAA
uniref:IST1-like protein n=1 Tax=Cajanus cajan TaxID=3821 RepID=A0A151RB69_CAJCA|nr:IST1-like protein [Cajanus cajan]